MAQDVGAMQKRRRKRPLSPASCSHCAVRLSNMLELSTALGRVLPKTQSVKRSEMRSNLQISVLYIFKGHPVEIS